MADLGDPISYQVLSRGTPVFSAEGVEMGAVDHVLAGESEDVFDGIVIRRPLDHRHSHAFADADQVASIHELGVTLNIATGDSESLPAPVANPGVMREDPGESFSPFQSRLRRAWDWVSGNY